MKPNTTPQPQDQLRDAAAQALKFLEDLGRNHWGNRSAVMAALQDALATPDNWCVTNGDGECVSTDSRCMHNKPSKLQAAQQETASPETANKQAPDSEDILLWPDDMTGPTWCWRHELSEMSHMSDDFEVLPFGSPRHQAFLASFNAPRETGR